MSNLIIILSLIKKIAHFILNSRVVRIVEHQLLVRNLHDGVGERGREVQHHAPAARDEHVHVAGCVLQTHVAGSAYFEHVFPAGADNYCVKY